MYVHSALRRKLQIKETHQGSTIVIAMLLLKRSTSVQFVPEEEISKEKEAYSRPFRF